MLNPRPEWPRQAGDSEAATLIDRFDRATLLTHRFAKRAVLRLEQQRNDGTAKSAIAKFYRRGSTAAETSADIHRKLGDTFTHSGRVVAVPRVEAVMPRMSGLLMQDVAGVPVSELVNGERIAAMPSAGTALAHLHAAPLDGLGEYSIDDEIRLLRNWVEFTTGLDPSSVAVLADKLVTVERDLLRCESFEPRTIHRDFHERQVLYSDRSATLIDFDTVRLGDPAQDIGNFLAHLKLAELVSGDRGDAARATFLEGYKAASVATQMDDGYIGAHERATFLRLALINWFNERNRESARALLDGI